MQKRPNKRPIANTLWLTIADWMRTHSLPGLKKVPIYNLLRFIWAEVEDDALTTRANSMAFSFFLAMFPGMIFLITLLPYFPFGDDFISTLQGAIEAIMPGQSGRLVFQTLQELLLTKREGLLSVGFFLALWFSSNGMISMMYGLRKDNPELFKKHNFWQERLVAIQLTFLLTITLFASVVLVILGNILLNFAFTYIKADWLTKMSFFAFRWVVIVSLFYSGISLIYRYGSTIRKRIPFVNAGATLATILSISASWGFSFFVDNFSTYNKVYGSIGTIIAFLLWIQINCFILLIGFELNAGIATIRHLRNNQSPIHHKS
ncbi:MAG: YihY/virulence factor BrkB family protein [Chitinophagales bacterium]|jgi:membrane protein